MVTFTSCGRRYKACLSSIQVSNIFKPNMTPKVNREMKVEAKVAQDGPSNKVEFIKVLG